MMTHLANHDDTPRGNAPWWLLPSVHGIVLLAAATAWAVASSVT